MSDRRAARRNSNLARPLMLVALAGALISCDWFTDFKDQPKIEPWESVADSIPPRGNPQNSVPIHGGALPAFVVSYSPLPATIDSMSALQNPVVADSASLANGGKLYQINCAVCHGVAGRGDGPVARYGFPGITLVSERVQGLSDGYLWGMIRNGRGLMPSYNRIEALERWHVVNYMRGLQGRYTVTTVMAPPGVTGDALPGATPRAPTRPAPYYASTNLGGGRQATQISTPQLPGRGAVQDTAAPRAATDTLQPGGRRP